MARGNFVWVDLGSRLGFREAAEEKHVFQKLLDGGVYVAPGTAYHNPTAGWYRVTFSVARDNLEVSFCLVVGLINRSDLVRLSVFLVWRRRVTSHVALCRRLMNYNVSMLVTCDSELRCDADPDVGVVIRMSEAGELSIIRFRAGRSRGRAMFTEYLAAYTITLSFHYISFHCFV